MQMNEQLLSQLQEQPLAGSGSLPDSNTAEAILYGKAYSWIKSALWVWDEMEDYLMRKAEQLDGQIIDREWSYHVMRHNRYLIYARSPPVNEVSHLKDLFTLHDLVKCVAGIRKIEEYRRQNLAWARMQGVQHFFVQQQILQKHHMQNFLIFLQTRPGKLRITLFKNSKIMIKYHRGCAK